MSAHGSGSQWEPGWGSAGHVRLCGCQDRGSQGNLTRARLAAQVKGVMPRKVHSAAASLPTHFGDTAWVSPGYPQSRKGALLSESFPCYWCEKPSMHQSCPGDLPRALPGALVAAPFLWLTSFLSKGSLSWSPKASLVPSSAALRGRTRASHSRHAWV